MTAEQRARTQTCTCVLPLPQLCLMPYSTPAQALCPPPRSIHREYRHVDFQGDPRSLPRCNLDVPHGTSYNRAEVARAQEEHKRIQREHASRAAAERERVQREHTRARERAEREHLQRAAAQARAANQEQQQNRVPATPRPQAEQVLSSKLLVCIHANFAATEALVSFTGVGSLSPACGKQSKSIVYVLMHKPPMCIHHLQAGVHWPPPVSIPEGLEERHEVPEVFK